MPRCRRYSTLCVRYLYDLQTLKSQKDLAKLQGRNNTWFCGSYFGYGFHEDGIKSALNIINQI